MMMCRCDILLYKNILQDDISMVENEFLSEGVREIDISAMMLCSVYGCRAAGKTNTPRILIMR